MLTKFNIFCESVLTEGRKSDDKKKFKVNIDKAKNHIKDIGTKHHHYILLLKNQNLKLKKKMKVKVKTKTAQTWILIDL